MLPKLYLFGDSICSGQGVSIHKGWVTLLSERLYNRAVITNASISGRTSRQALEDMPYQIQEQHPDILIIQFGMNDCNYWKSDRGLPRVSPKSFEANLNEMIKRSLAFKVKRTFLNTNHCTKLTTCKIPNTTITYEKSNNLYNNIIRNVSKNNDVILNDVEKAFFDSKEDLKNLLLPDLLHPNEQGHELYFNCIYPALTKEIEKIYGAHNV